MYILELESIPRDKELLQSTIRAARAANTRKNAIRFASGAIVFVALCVLLFGVTKAAPHKTVNGHVYLPLVMR